MSLLGAVHVCLGEPREGRAGLAPGRGGGVGVGEVGGDLRLRLGVHDVLEVVVEEHLEGFSDLLGVRDCLDGGRSLTLAVGDDGAVQFRTGGGGGGGDQRYEDVVIVHQLARSHVAISEVPTRNLLTSAASHAGAGSPGGPGGVDHQSVPAHRLQLSPLVQSGPLSLVQLLHY